MCTGGTFIFIEVVENIISRLEFAIQFLSVALDLDRGPMCIHDYKEESVREKV